MVINEALARMALPTKTRSENALRAAKAIRTVNRFGKKSSG
jgi:hypothetical protein